MHAPLTLRAATAQAHHALHYGSAAHPLLLIVPDAAWPDMWRVVWAGGASDFGNLARAKDAAILIAEKGPPVRDAQRLRWRISSIGEAHRRLVVPQSGVDGVP